MSWLSRQLFILHSLDIYLSMYYLPSPGTPVFFKIHLPYEILADNTNTGNILFFSPVSLTSLYIFFQCKHSSSVILYPSLYKLFRIDDYKRQTDTLNE